VPPEDLKPLVEGNTDFAVELYKKVATSQDGNLILSPYSISSALAMTYAGARGETAEQMAKTLHFTLPQERLHPAFGGTTKWLTAGRRKPYDLDIANALWVKRGLPLTPEFLSLTKRSYAAGLQEVNFGDPQGAEQTINHWVAEHTHDKIKDLLRGDVDRSTSLVLTNAIYFRGKWKQRFDKADTRDEDFELTPGVKVQVPTMRLSKAKVRSSYSHPDFWLRELPYEGNRLALVILVPKKRCALREVEAQLTAASLTNELAKMREGEDEVILPRFKFDSRFYLGRELTELGMPLAFTEAADFSGITTQERLSIAKVIHQGLIEVDEEGTVAAAATAVAMREVSTTVPKVRFLPDHPFLFLIRDTQAGNILFLGRVTDPRSGIGTQ